MNKVYRFMKEYANFQKACLDACDLMNDGIRQEMKNLIDIYIRKYERGFITVDECMYLLTGKADENKDFSAYAI